MRVGVDLEDLSVLELTTPRLDDKDVCEGWKDEWQDSEELHFDLSSCLSSCLSLLFLCLTYCLAFQQLRTKTAKFIFFCLL